jgi:hypothetical protein
VYGLSSQVFNIVRGMANTVDWSDPFFIEFLGKAVMVFFSEALLLLLKQKKHAYVFFKDFRKEMVVVGDHVKLKDWVHPLHYRKTGSVLGAGRRLHNALRELVPTVDELVETVSSLSSTHKISRTREKKLFHLRCFFR